MTSIPFCKFHGFGNDYIVIEKVVFDDNISISDLARSICHRHTGAGSDGVAVLEKLDGDAADYHCEIVNPDGSIAGFSGNGTRCAVAYLYYKKIWSRPALRLETRSGIKNYTLIERMADGHYWFEAEIGKPKFASDEIPLLTDSRIDKIIDRRIPVGDDWVNISAVNVGNPVACIFVRDFDIDWRRLGRELESHEAFPERANIVFVKVTDRDNIDIRIWERGAGETSSSGTCATAAAVLSAFTGKTDRTVSVHTEGGVTEVFWREDDEILLTGRADLVYCGEWFG
ncbi:MAG TPA: diaminopimelate epimerase [Pyrinomonadaceae bacterium]|nr:diaminopimelate epimerase [Pyrinomonadaceae bacterium]